MLELTNGLLDPGAGSHANVFYALARALEPPRSWDADLPGLLASSLGTMPEPLGKLGQKLSRQVSEILEDREQAAIDHAKLFLGPFEILVAPWASFYLEREPRLMGPTSTYAARAYAEAGLAPGNKLKDVPDHVTHELEFMYFMAFSQATTGDPMWADRQARFWREHLGCWLPKFAEALEHVVAHPFYQTLAQTIAGICAIESDVLGTPSPAASCEAETPT
ncbi:MAG: molecular chaperone TorD family protein [Gemmatimonadota bacterium]